MKPKPPLSKDDVRQHLKPYAIEIGELSLAWNSLHDHLGQIFWAAIGSKNGTVALAIWNKVSNDRMQRELLKSVVDVGGILRGPDGRRGTDDVLWLIKKTGDLAELRNSAVHAPLTTLTDMATGITRVAPQDFFGNPRAKRLAGKPELLAELIWYRESVETLLDFSVDLASCIAFPAAKWPWPDRPVMPTFQHQNHR